MPIDLVEWRKQYYEKNREKMLAASKEYYAKNKDKCKATLSANHLKNITADPEYYNKKSNEHYLKSKDYYKEYYKQNREAIIERQKAYYYKMKLNSTDPNFKTKFNKSKYAKGSALALKKAFIETQLAELLIKKEAFKKKLAEEAALNNNIVIP
jgi:hypothetical protein